MNHDLTNLLVKRLKNSLDLTVDLYESMDEESLTMKIPQCSSNTIGSQAWCLIGARESYFSAIENSKWIGFSCSVKDHTNKQEISQKLNTLNHDILEYLQTNSLTSIQSDFVFDLLEHEVQHHGQLIRYFYANKLKFPSSWNKRYTV